MIAPLALALLPQGLVYDINVSAPPNGGNTIYGIDVDASGRVFFIGSSPTHGGEPYVWDGQQTQRLADLAPGTAGGAVGAPFAHQGQVYFSGGDPSVGFELMSTDGTEAGTTLVRDLNVGLASAFPAEFLANGSNVLFTGRDFSGVQIWSTDGTFAGTYRVTSHSAVSPSELAFSNGQLFYQGRIANADRELFVSDVTTNGSVFLADLWSGSSRPADFLPLGPVTVMTAVVGFHSQGGPARSLFQTDGTPEGTGIIPSSERLLYEVEEIVAFDGSVYVSAKSDSNGRELWRLDNDPVDPSVILATLVKDIEPAAADSRPEGLTVFQGALYFSAGASGVRELYVSDGTALGTHPLDSIRGMSGSEPENIAVFGSSLVYSALDATGDRELWMSDGTPGGSAPLLDLNPLGSSSPSNFASGGGVLAFVADGGPTIGRELYVTDGTAGGTELISDLTPPSGGPGSNPGHFIAFGDTLLFDADDGVNGRQVWTSDGTAEGTALLDVPVDEAVALSFEFDDKLYVQTSAGGLFNPEVRLYTTDEASGFVLVPVPGFEETFDYFSGPVATSNGLYFRGGPGGPLQEPWRMTLSGEFIQLADVHPQYSSSPGGFTELRPGVVLFTAYNETVGAEPYVTDGTPEGTLALGDLNPGSLGSGGEFHVFNDLAYFTARVGFVDQVWRTDGTPAGTEAFADGKVLAVLGDKLFFTAGSLHETDGTLAGTKVYAGSGDSGWLEFGDRMLRVQSGQIHVTDPQALTLVQLFDSPGLDVALDDIVVAGDRAFFRVQTNFDPEILDPEGQLWTTDGTVEGTFRVSEFDTPGLVVTGDNITSLTPLGSGSDVIFRAEDLFSGGEVWVGDENGSELYLDLAPGDSNPQAFFRVGSKVFFTADDGATGRELYVLPLADAGGYSIANYGEGCVGSNNQIPVIGATGKATIGETVTLGLSNGIPGEVGTFYFAFSRLALDPGLGCVLYLGVPFGPLVNAGAFGLDGTVSADVGVPPLPQLVGSTLYIQGLLTDVGGPVFGIGSMSGGLELVIGN